VSWLVFDLHGSMAGLCPAGTSVLSDAYRYGGYGQQVASNGSSVDPYRYRGLLNLGADDLAGALLSMGARDYSSQLGTFTQEDSVAGGAANPATMNRFLYASPTPRRWWIRTDIAQQTAVAAGASSAANPSLLEVVQPNQSVPVAVQPNQSVPVAVQPNRSVAAAVAVRVREARRDRPASRTP
jgi:RHS repeat-associated protein